MQSEVQVEAGFLPVSEQGCGSEPGTTCFSCLEMLEALITNANKLGFGLSPVSSEPPLKGFLSLSLLHSDDLEWYASSTSVEYDPLLALLASCDVAITPAGLFSRGCL